jgi:hypothetical protein
MPQKFFDQLLNNTYEFPDDATPEAIRQVVTPLHEQHFQKQKQQQLVEGMSGLGQAIFSATQREQRSPVVSPVAAMAMGPNYQSHRESQLQDIRNQQQQRQFDASQQQRQHMATAQQRMQERQMVAQQMEQEKDRSQQLHLETQRQKNRQEEMRLQQQAQKEMEEWKRQQPQYDPSRGVQYKIDPNTGNYVTSVIDQGVYDDAIRPPQYGRGGGGGTSRGKQPVVGFLPGYERSPGPNGTQGWVNPLTGEFLSEGDYAQRLTVENAWEKLYAPQRGNYYRNQITGEERGGGTSQQQGDNAAQQQADLAKQKWLDSRIPKDIPPADYAQAYQEWSNVYDRMNGGGQEPAIQYQNDAPYSDMVPPVNGQFMGKQPAAAQPAEGDEREYNGMKLKFVNGSWIEI